MVMCGRLGKAGWGRRASVWQAWLGALYHVPLRFVAVRCGRLGMSSYGWVK